MNESLIESIKDEITVCNRVLHETYIEGQKLQERINNYNDRKIVLTELLEKAEADVNNDGICAEYKDKSLLIERKALYEKVEELLIGHGYINPDTAISECLEIIENFPTADVEPEKKPK